MVLSQIINWFLANKNAILVAVVAELIVISIIWLFSTAKRQVKNVKSPTIKIVAGIVLTIIGMAVLFYGYQISNSGFQIKYASNPNFITNALTKEFGGLGISVIGFLIMIKGGLIINRDATIKIMEHISRNMAKNEE